MECKTFLVAPETNMLSDVKGVLRERNI